MACEPDYRTPDDDEPVAAGMDERQAWVQLLATVATTLAYAAVVAPRALDQPIDEVAWVGPMLWAIGINIALSVGGSITVGIGGAIGLHLRGVDPDIELASDERDRDIGRYASRRTVGFAYAAMLASLVLAMIGADSFWIGNAVFACGAVGSTTEAALRLRAYRRGIAG